MSRCKQILMAAVSFLAITPLAAQAATYYWDSDGATAGFGSTTGTWGTDAFWSTSSAGTAATANPTITTADDVNFGTATLNYNNATITGPATAQGFLNMTFGAGQTTALTLSGGTLDLAATSTITQNSSSTMTISSVLQGVGSNLVKAGGGTLALNGSAVNTFAGGVTVNAGTLLLDFANLSTPTDLINSGNALSLGSGTLLIQGKSSGSTSQTLGNLTLTGGGRILVNPNGGTDTTLTLGTIPTGTANTTLLIGQAAGAGSGGLTITTTSDKDATGIYGGRVVYTTDGGTTVDWATTASGGSPYTLAGYNSYTTLPPSGGSSTTNYRMTAATTLTGSVSVNTLKLEAPGGNLDLVSNLLTIQNGGLLMTGTDARSITGNGGATRLTAGADSNYQLIVHQYNTAATGLTISAVIGNNGVNPVSLVKSGTGVLTLSGTNTYTGRTTINAGTLSIGDENRLGSNPGAFTADQLLLNGGTLRATNNVWIDDTNRGITLGASGVTFEVDATRTLTIPNIITGAGSLTKTGAGTLNLRAINNSYTGATIINGGILDISAGLLANGGSNSAIGAASTDAANLVLDGGTLLRNGNTNVVGGAQSATSTNRLFTVGVGGATFNSSGSNGNFTLSFTNTGAMATTGTGARTITLISSNAGGGSNNNTMAVQLIDQDGSNPTSLVMSGSGRWMLSNTNNTYTGTTTINSGSTLEVQGSIATSGSVANSGVLQFSGTGAQTYNNAIGGTGRLLKTAAGTLSLGGANTYTGRTNIERNGILEATVLADGGVNSSIGASNNTQGNLILGIAAGVNQSGTLRYTGGTATTDRNFSLQYSSSIDSSGTGPLTFSQTGAISPDVTDTGTTTAGSAVITGLSNTANLAIGMYISMTGVPTNRWITSIDSATQITINNGASVTAGTNSASFGTSSPRTLTLTGSNTGANTIAGILQNSTALPTTGTLSLTKSGAGTWVLGGANTYTGATSINAGTLALSGVGTLGTGSALTLGGGNLDLGTTSQTVGAVSVTAPAGSGDTISNGSLTGTSYAASNTTGNAIISANLLVNGAAGFAKTGAGTVTLSGANTYTGLTTVTAGTLAYGASNVIATGDVTVNGATAILSLGTNSDSAGTVTLDGGGSITSSTGVLTSTTSFEMKSGSVSAILDGSGTPLNKTTSGTVTLSGSNTYTGLTTVTAGTLLVNGNQSAATGAVTVANLATLGGTGTIGGAVTVQSGGTYSPGTSPGTLIHAANLVLDAGSTFKWEHTAGNALGTAGTDFDVASLTGGASLTVTSGAKIALNFAGTTDFTNTFWDTNQTWNIVTGAGGGSSGNFAAGDFSILGSLQTSSNNTIAGEGSFSTNLSGSNLVLAWTALSGVPVVTWGAGDGLWSTATNWTPNTVPDVAAATANFTGLGPSAVNLNGNRTVGKVALTGGGYTLGAESTTDKLQMDNGTTNAAEIKASSGTHTVNARVYTAAPGKALDVIATGTGSSLTLKQGIDNTLGANLLLKQELSATLLSAGDVVNAGAMTVSGTVEAKAISGAGSTSVTGSGSSLTANSIVQNTLTIGSGASVTIRETATGGAGASPVPEPGTWALIGVGLLSLLAFRRRR